MQVKLFCDIPIITMDKESYKEALRQSRFRGCCYKPAEQKKKLTKIEKRWHTHYYDE